VTGGRRPLGPGCHPSSVVPDPDERVRLRAAGPEHGALLLGWREDPEIRAASFTTEPLTPEEHSGWLVRTLTDPNSRLLIVELDQRPVGQVLMQRVGEEAKVRLGLTAVGREQGVEKRALELAAAVARDELGVRAV
jgi:UDP-2,4-diacetamido-2,4,6-trideoxy-beta-L-altropyranose hydrolase